MDKNERDNLIKDSTSQSIDPGFFRFVTLKLNRLSSATYMVTNFMPDNEPIKWRLRNAVLDLTVDLTPGQVSSVLYRVSVLEKIINKFDGLMALLDIAMAAGSASEMNLAILKKEYAALRESIVRKSPHQFLENYMVSGLLDTPLNPPARDTRDTAEPEAQNRSESTSISLSSKSSIEMSNDRPITPAASPKVQAPKPINNGSTDASKNRRKQLILQYLEGKGWTSIKDIADIITDCSRKTVQRELADMVDQGILKKKGDRRWSRYVIS